MYDCHVCGHGPGYDTIQGNFVCMMVSCVDMVMTLI